MEVLNIVNLVGVSLINSFRNFIGYFADNPGVATLLLAIFTFASILWTRKEHKDQMEQAEIDRKRSEMDHMVSDLEGVISDIVELEGWLEGAEGKIDKYIDIRVPRIEKSLIKDVKGENKEVSERLDELKIRSERYKNNRRRLESEIKSTILDDLSPDDDESRFHPPCYDNPVEFRRAKDMVFNPALQMNDNVRQTEEYLKFLREDDYADRFEELKPDLDFLVTNTTEIREELEELVDEIYQKYDILRTVDRE